MERQEALFTPLPSHIYVAAHWAPGGWEITCTQSYGGGGRWPSQRDAYGPLSASELVDVVAALLERATTP